MSIHVQARTNLMKVCVNSCEERLTKHDLVWTNGCVNVSRKDMQIIIYCTTMSTVGVGYQ